MSEAKDQLDIRHKNNVSQDDEIDLFELWNGLVQQKYLILGSFVVVVLLATIYAFSVKPVYQSEAFLIPAERESIQKIADWDLLLDRTNKDKDLVDELFELSKQTMLNRSLLLEFFLENKLYSVYDKELSNKPVNEFLKDKQQSQNLFKQFSDEFIVEEASKKSFKRYFSVSLSMPVSDETVQGLLANFISKARHENKFEILQTIKSEQQARIAQLNQKMTIMREIAKSQKNDRIAQLDEAITIAHSLNLKEPPEMGAKATIQGVSNQGLPLYYLGYRLLEAERNALNNRQSNDPFIGGLRGIQQQISLLKSYEISLEDFAAVRVDQPASVGKKIKPKKSLILAVAGVLGLMLGVFIALIKGALAKRKQEEAAAVISE